MATKADFNAEEWSKVVEAPMLAGMRVASAQRGGTIRESVAVGRVYQEARQGHAESELLDQLVASPPSIDPQGLQGGGDIASIATDRLREALRLIDEKGAQGDGEAYRRFIAGVARAAAEAHKEGGFVGIGGKPVSDSEQAAIDEIEAVLDEGS